MYTIEIKDANGKVIYTTQVDTDKPSGLVRLVNATLDEAFGDEEA